jgi:hypothetical protein
MRRGSAVRFAGPSRRGRLGALALFLAASAGGTAAAIWSGFGAVTLAVSVFCLGVLFGVLLSAVVATDERVRPLLVRALMDAQRREETIEGHAVEASPPRLGR